MLLTTNECDLGDNYLQLQDNRNYFVHPHEELSDATDLSSNIFYC